MKFAALSGKSIFQMPFKGNRLNEKVDSVCVLWMLEMERCWSPWKGVKRGKDTPFCIMARCAGK